VVLSTVVAKYLRVITVKTKETEHAPTFAVTYQTSVFFMLSDLPAGLLEVFIRADFFTFVLLSFLLLFCHPGQAVACSLFLLDIWLDPDLLPHRSG
jgi:hypothetical protein